MKKQVLYLAVAILSIGLFTTSCGEDDVVDNEKPVVENLEVGEDGVVHVHHEDVVVARTDSEGDGDEHDHEEGMHLEFDVSDNDRLAYYTIDIHIDEDHDHPSSSDEHVEWEYENTFTEIAGLKNYTVHHHDIVPPENAELGDYHFHLIVVDRSGNTTSIEMDIELAEEEDGEMVMRD